MTWRDRARPIIAAVLAENADSDMKTKRRALRDAYPFGARKYHPYKAWCSEARRQLGIEPTPSRSKHVREVRAAAEMPGQLGFLGGDE